MKFSLNRQIRFWRWQLYIKGAFRSNDIDELESHLREEIDYLTRLGSSEAEAFRKAVERLGEVDYLKQEFMKINFVTAWSRRVALTIFLIISFFILFAQCSNALL